MNYTNQIKNYKMEGVNRNYTGKSSVLHATVLAVVDTSECFTL